MIYFDNAATTKPSSDAVKKANEYNEKMFFNPSALYRAGLKCSNDIKEAKSSILKNLGAAESKFDVIFTSGGTESDNTAIFCSVKRGVFITDKGEHSAVIKCFNELKNKGHSVWLCGLNEYGEIDKTQLFNYINENKPDFVSIMHVNNETGAINDINFIAETVKKINRSAIFHSDGVQAYGKIPYTISDDIDFYSISAHKINALKGVGALIKRKKTNLNPLIFGGGQEYGLRSGTENVFGIKAFQYAGEEHYKNLRNNAQNILKIKNYIIENLDKNLYKIISSEQSSPYILSVSAVGVRGEVLMHMLEEKDIIVGNGSACSSKNRFSRVLEACGYGKEILDGVIRISFSFENTIQEAEEFVRVANDCAQKLKGIM